MQATALTPQQLEAANDAFTRAATTTATKGKTKRKMVIEDDEEDEDEEMEEVQVENSTTAADYDVELKEIGSAGEGGGGFMPEDANTGGGFMPDDSAGGFMPEDDGGGGDDDFGGGGFLPDDNDIGSSTGGGGGFLPDPDADDRDPFSTSGGFLPDPSASASLPPLPSIPTAAELAQDPNNASIPSYVALSAAPGALAALKLPLAAAGLFHDVAEVDPDAPADADGKKALRVSRARFLEACEVLLAGRGDDFDVDGEQDDDDAVAKPRRRLKKGGRKASTSGSEDDSGDDGEAYEDGEKGDSSSRRRRRAPTRTTRRSTRANPVEDDVHVDKAALQAMDLDMGLPADDDDGSEAAYDDDSGDSDVVIVSPNSAGGKKGKGKAKGKGPKRKTAKALTEQEMREAEDTFELFFDEDAASGRSGLPLRERKIGLADLKRVANVLNVKMSEDDVRGRTEWRCRANRLTCHLTDARDARVRVAEQPVR